MVRDDLKDALKLAMREKNQRKVATIRLILAAVKDRDIALRGDDRSPASDDQLVLDILAKMVKQRRDSIVAYEAGGRADLAEQEREEIEVIESFMPRQLSEAEINAASREIVDELAADGLKDMGRCMGELKARYAGQMDFAKASNAVKALLSS